MFYAVSLYVVIFRNTTPNLNKDSVIHTYIIFGNVLCQAPYHNCIVRYFIFISISICISRGIPTHPGRVTVTSNNRFCISTTSCGLQRITVLQHCVGNQFQSFCLHLSEGSTRVVLEYLVTSS